MKNPQFRKSLLIATLLGAVLPIALLALFEAGTTQTSSIIRTAENRDLLLLLNMAFGGVLCLGTVLALPGMLVAFGLYVGMTTVHQQGHTIPLLDMLPPMAEGAFMMLIAIGCNVGTWLVPVSIFRWFMREETHEEEKHEAH